MKGLEVVTLILVAALLSAGNLGPVECQLSATYYNTSCANVVQIVRDAVGASMNSSQIVGPGVLRLFAHDCFVGGCDGSILLQDTPGAPSVERDDPDNLSLQQLAFDTINQAKAAVEAQCPGIVSCTDVLSIASMDVVNMMGGPSWTVLLGRRDGVNSSAAAVVGHLPGADMDVNQLMGIFSSINLSRQDLVTLSGAHTVGFAHCKEFSSRLYDFNNVTGASDPSLNANYTSTLQGLCPNGNFSNTTVQALDPVSSGTFDNAYYQDLLTGQGLLFSDQVLFVDNTTTNLVTTYANNQQQFFNDFLASMIAMSQVGVLTGTQGEIRLNCSVVNGPNSVPSPPPPPAVIPSPPSVVTPSPPPVVTTPPPPTPVVTPSPPPAAVTPPPPPPPSPPPPVVTSSPPTPLSSSPPPPPPFVTPSPPPPVTPSPPPPPVTPSPPPVTPSPPPPPVVTPSPPPPVTPSPPPPVTPSPPPPVTPSPPPPVTPSPPPPVTPSPPPPVTPSPPPTPTVTPSPPPPPVVTPSPPPPVVTPPPPPVVTSSPPPPVVTPSPPPPVTSSPPPPVATPSPPPPVVTPSPPPPVTPSPPPPPVVTPSPAPPPVTPSPPPPPPAPVVAPSPPPLVTAPPPPGGRRRF